MPSQETQIALLASAVERLQEEAAERDARISAMERERDRALIWGISALGTALLGLVAWIGNYIVTHVKLTGG